MGKKFFAAALVLLTAFLLLFSAVFIALEADHDCCGEDCAVCAQIRLCEDLIRDLLTAAAPAAAAACCLSALRFVFAAADCFSFHPRTLIALKVKLSD